MEGNNNGITPELIAYILEKVEILLDIKAPVEPILPENPTPEQIEEYNKAMEEYTQQKAEYDNIVQVLTLYIEIICNNILIETNRRIFPEPLKYVVIDLVKDKFDSNNTENPELNTIKSMSEYDRTVSFGASSILQSKLELLAQQQVRENLNLINKFKLLYRS